MGEIVSGLEGVVVAQTRSSHVDGEAGRLTVAGFPVERLAPAATFEEVLFLLWEGRLPAAPELDALREDLARHRAVPAETLDLLRRCAARDLPPMDALRVAAGSTSLLDDDPRATSRADEARRGRLLVATFPTIVAAYARL